MEYSLGTKIFGSIFPLKANKKNAGFQDLNIYQLKRTGDLKEQQGTPEPF